jgi:hypothetical protein
MEKRRLKMSKTNHLKRAVKILRENFGDEIDEDCDPCKQDDNYPANDWTWNLKNWNIQFTKSKDYESVVAYKAYDGLTNWSEYVTLEARQCEWRDLV